MSRVTENMVFSSLIAGIGRVQNQLLQSNHRVGSGLKVERPSDDPVTASRAMAYTTGIERLGAMGRAADRAELTLKASDTALGGAGTILARIQEIAIAGAGTGFSALDRQVMAGEVDALRTSLVALANTRAGDAYVFGGFQTTTAPFLASGVFVGDANVPTAEIAPSVVVPMSGSGAMAFTAAGGQDVFALLTTLRADLLANDPVAVQGLLSSLDQATTQVRVEQMQVGISLQRLQQGEDTRASLLLQLRDSLQTATEIDTATAAVELNRAQQALQAAIGAASQVVSALRDALRL